VLLAFPRGRSSAALEDGGSLISRERPGSWSLTIRGKRRRTWTISASLATLERPFKPCALSATGGKVKRWSYDPKTQVLHATFTVRHATLVARGC
jgi:hypothetical protein